MVNDRELSFLLRSGSSVSLKEHSTDSPELLPSRYLTLNFILLFIFF